MEPAFLAKHRLVFPEVGRFEPCRYGWLATTWMKTKVAQAVSPARFQMNCKSGENRHAPPFRGAGLTLL